MTLTVADLCLMIEGSALTESHQHKRRLGVRDMTLFTVSAILLLDTLSAIYCT